MSGLFATWIVGFVIYCWNLFVLDASSIEALIATFWPGVLIAVPVGLYVQKLEDDGRI